MEKQRVSSSNFVHFIPPPTYTQARVRIHTHTQAQESRTRHLAFVYIL